MELAGQGLHTVAHARVCGSRGYAMAALLVALSVMAVLMGALLPVWTHMATREKETELIFRGNQYARAIGLFQRKFANTPPPSIDVLVEQRFLRKKYKDPITKDDFQPIYANQALQQGVSSPTGAQRPGQQTTSNLGTPAQQRPLLNSGLGNTGIGAQGGIIGVTSKSKETSIKAFNGRTHYNEWAFVYIQTVQRPGQPGAPAGVPGQRPGMQPGVGGPGGMGGPGGRGGPGQQPSPFGQPPGGGFGQPQPFGQPNRPPFPQPGGFQNPNTIQGPGGTTFTPMVPGQRPPAGQRPPGQ